MSRFDYDAYEEKSKDRKEAFKNKQKVEFLNNYLKEDGSSIIVRFPYTSTKDFDVETCHEVKLPEYKYNQKIKCLRGTEDSVDVCPLCKDGVKLTRRFLVKAIAYILEGTQLKLVPVIWDRPYSYARELGGKLTEYGDLSEQLFKIKRNGLGVDTTYSTDIVLNKTVYNPQLYIKDLSGLDEVTPSAILIRPVSKYTGINDVKVEKTKEELKTPNTSFQETITSTPTREVVHVEEKPAVPFQTQPKIEETQPQNTSNTTNPADGRPRRYTY